jgi:hypothetical protein
MHDSVHMLACVVRTLQYKDCVFCGSLCCCSLET